MGNQKGEVALLSQFDTAVATLVFCTVSDQAQALRELRRVLKPGGRRLFFIEHVRSDRPRLASGQDRLNSLNRFVAHGRNCEWHCLSGCT